MSIEKIARIRALAEAHKATHRSAKIILELLAEIEHLQEINGYALEAVYSAFPKRAQARARLKRMRLYE